MNLQATVYASLLCPKCGLVLERKEGKKLICYNDNCSLYRKLFFAPALPLVEVKDTQQKAPEYLVVKPEQERRARAIVESSQSVGLHNCTPGYDDERDDFVFSCRGQGVAVERCEGDRQGRLWVGYEKCRTQANFCPFCGYRAKTQVEWKGTAVQGIREIVQDATPLDMPVMLANPSIALWAEPTHRWGLRVGLGIEDTKRLIDAGGISKCDLCDAAPAECIEFQGGVLALCGKHFEHLTVLLPDFAGVKEAAEWLAAKLEKEARELAGGGK